jgi:hypothetical protein
VSLTFWMTEVRMCDWLEGRRLWRVQGLISISRCSIRSARFDALLLLQNTTTQIFKLQYNRSFTLSRQFIISISRCSIRSARFDALLLLQNTTTQIFRLQYNRSFTLSRQFIIRCEGSPQNDSLLSDDLKFSFYSVLVLAALPIQGVSGLGPFRQVPSLPTPALLDLDFRRSFLKKKERTSGFLCGAMTTSHLALLLSS